MSLVFSLTDFVHDDLDLVDLSGSDYRLVLDGGVAFPPSENYVIHQVEGDVQIAYHQDEIREVRVPIWLTGTRDNALNKAQAIHRWLQQAVYANKDSVADYPVYLKIQEPGATNATVHRVLRGTFDESAGHLTPFTQKSASTGLKSMGVLTLWLFPTGTTVEPLRLDNKLPGSPAMNRYAVSGSNVIPHGWNSIDGGETLTVKFDKAAVGFGYLQVVAGADTYGVYTDYATVPAYHLARGLVYIYIVSGTWTIRMESASGTLASVTGLTNANQAANADDTVESRDGMGTWYAIDLLQSTESTDVQFRLRFIATSAGTIHIDAAQIRSVEPYNVLENPSMDGVTDPPVPDGWEVDSNSYTVAGQDNSNYATASNALTVTFDRTVHSGDDPAGEEAQFLRTVLCAPETIDHDWIMQLSVRILSHDGQTCKISLRDGAHNELDSVSFTNATLASVDEGTYTGDDAATYSIIKLEGTNSAANGVYVIVQQTDLGGTPGTDLSLIIDEARIIREEQPVFSSAYISGTGVLANRNDWDDTADANYETYFNHFRVYNLPGNRPALLNFRLGFLGFSQGGKVIFLGRYTERKRRLLQYQLEAENFDDTSGTWAVVNDAAYGHSSAHRFTGAGNTEGYLTSPLADQILLDWAGAPRVVFARAMTNNATPANDYVRFAMAHHYDELIIENEERGRLTTQSTWELLYLGEMDLYYSERASNFSRVQPRIRVYARADTSQLLTIDFLWCFPAEKDGWTSFLIPELGPYEGIFFDSVNREVIRQSEGIPSPDVRGAKQITARPGPISTAFTLGWISTANAHVISETALLYGVEVYPQTTTLLGTK